jgi:hypothetical protein
MLFFPIISFQFLRILEIMFWFKLYKNSVILF